MEWSCVICIKQANGELFHLQLSHSMITKYWRISWSPERSQVPLIGNHCFCWCTWHCQSYCWALNGCSTALQDVEGWRSLLAALHPSCFILNICSVPLWWKISASHKLPTKAPALFWRNRWVSVKLVLIELMDSSYKSRQKIISY